MVTGADGTENGPVPAMLIAATRNVYDVPFDSPLTTAVVAVLTSAEVGPAIQADPPLDETSTL
jgi:hypothetical protein